MISETTGPDEVRGELTRLRHWEGTPAEFWPRLAACLAAVAGARRTVIVVKDDKAEATWKKVADYSPEAGQSAPAQHFTRRLQELAERGIAGSSVVIGLEGDQEIKDHAAVLRFDLGATEQVCIGVFLLVQVSAAAAAETARRLELVLDLPRSYQAFRANQQSREDMQKYATALDTVLLLDKETRFLGAGLSLANEIASRFECDRVSLGWLERGYVRLKAMSRTENFNRRMAAAVALEAAMEEALDQDEDLVLPAPDEARLVTRDHERYAKEQQCGHLASFPLRVEDRAVAVLTCERARRPFELIELRQLRLIGDLAARRMADLQRADRWFGARWATILRDQSARLVGPEHTWAKILTVLVTAILAVILFVRVPFRVEGNFQLRSEEVAYLTAPYDSFIREVLVRPGDVVPAGGALLRLDTEDLRLEESAAIADLQRYEREAEKARAEAALAEMRVAEALAEQAQARLGLVRYRLEHASLRAPYASVVVEGDLREQLGAPVRQGDALIRVARLDRLYVEAKVDERDVHELQDAQTGEIAFVSQPRLKFPVTVECLEPAALTDDAANVFLVRCRIDDANGEWWRPGMTGVCKLNAGKRTIAWIFTRRTIDFLRMFFWW